MSAHLNILQTLLLLFTVEVITVELCELKTVKREDIQDKGLGRVFKPTDIEAESAELFTKIHLITKCLPSTKTSGCGYCVASRKHLVNVSYIDWSSKKRYYRNTYNETSCVCSKTKPINDGGKFGDNTYGTKTCFMMMASSIILAVVCVGFSIIVIFLCLRYETCSKGSSKRRRQRDTNSNEMKNRKQNSHKPEAHGNPLIEKQGETDQV